MDIQAAQHIGAARDAVPFRRLHPAGTQFMRIDKCLCGDHTGSELLLAHFEGIDRDGSKSWHKAACDAIRDKANSPEGNLLLLKPDHQFTYGQAQKWVNMSLKYLYMMGFDDMSHVEQVIHVPVDSLIIDAANDLGVRWPSTSWSKLDNYPEYLTFQKKLRKIIQGSTERPLVWENHAWIEQARRRAEKAAR